MYFPVPGQGSPPKSCEVTWKVHSGKFEQRRSRIAFVWCWMQLKLQLVLPLLLQTCGIVVKESFFVFGSRQSVWTSFLHFYRFDLVINWSIGLSNWIHDQSKRLKIRVHLKWKSTVVGPHNLRIIIENYYWSHNLRIIIEYHYWSHNLGDLEL